MARHNYVMLGLLAAASSTSMADTFDETAILPDRNVHALTRQVAREHVDRNLLDNPYDAVVIGNVDVYDAFPYLEARYFQIVSDPGWNRLLLGEKDAGFDAFDGAGSALGALKEPRGLSVDGMGRLYVADTGNDRIAVFDVVTEFDEATLLPLFAIEGLRRPHDVVLSDGGTPFDGTDDRLYVADTGRNRVVAYVLDGTTATEVASVGALGDGTGRFAGPMAITVGRSDGRSTRDLYVADAHTRRLVHLHDTGTELEWIRDVTHDADIVTSLDTDHHGNLFTAAPNAGSVSKYTPTLERLADVDHTMTRPRSFHVPFINVTDHVAGTTTRQGRPQGVLVEEWSDVSGVRAWNLGIEAQGLEVSTEESVDATFTVTDHANVSVELTEVSSGRTVARRELSALASGSHRVSFDGGDFDAEAPSGEYALRVSARSRYDGGDADVVEARFFMEGTPALVPTRPALVGNHPNPFYPATRIGFLVPEGANAPARVTIFDARGRLVRALSSGSVQPGFNEVRWDGADAFGAPAAAGAYFYRLEVAGEIFDDKMILLR